MNDYETPEAFQREIRKARKNHICCECNGAIHAGEKYQHNSGIWDGTPDRYKVCLDCDALRCDMAKTDCENDFAPFLGLCDEVFERGETEFIRRFVEIKQKREAKVTAWMLERSAKK